VSAPVLYQRALRQTHARDSQAAGFLIHRCEHKEACEGGGDWGSIRLQYGGPASVRSACGDADQVRRVLGLALILDGKSPSDAAKMAGVTLQMVRDWVLRFNAGGRDGWRNGYGTSSACRSRPSR
jgi:hypothetical protein